ncbi:hypothetical protein [Actinoplanes sp. HUAS TT8]|uniref:hypothetical protein n=1 Tax=Actinoplanes sp. HUAS TT8 TaxID=3447453 RepID=UPI003F51EC67
MSDELTVAELALLRQADREAAAGLDFDVEAGLRAVHARRRPRRRSRWAGVLVPSIAFALVFCVLMLWGVAGLGQRGVAGCRGSGQTGVRFTAGQCIGLSATDEAFFGNDPVLRAVEADIFAANKRVDDIVHRPVVTVVLLGDFGHVDDLPEREALRGIRAAQRGANRAADDGGSGPYLQVVIANAGQAAAYAEIAVTGILDGLAGDRPIVGVITTLDGTIAATAALRRLAEARVPVLSPVTPPTGLDTGTSPVLRLTPSASVEARLVHAYATQVLKQKKLTNFFAYEGSSVTEDRDAYTDSLREALARVYGSGYSERISPTGTCPADGVIFYSGRVAQLGAFLARIRRDCTGRRPTLVAGASAARYLADPGNRASAPVGQAFAFMSSSYLGTCASSMESQFPPQEGYLRNLGDECASDPAAQATGWSALTYDAVGVLLRTGTEHATDPAAIDDHLRTWSTVDVYYGATGPVYIDDSNSHTPGDRFAAMLCVSDVRQAYSTLTRAPRMVGSTGTAYAMNPPLNAGPCGPA